MLGQEEFLRIVKDHQMTILKDDGLYRHLVFKRPNTGCYSFGFVTWPGYLCYYGDMGEYVFCRIDDMFDFFWRKEDKGIYINPGYWSEKVEASDRDGIKEYCPKKAERVIREILADAEASPELIAVVEEDVLSWVEESEQEFRHAAYDFSYGDFEFSDFWEYDLTEFTYRFIFCCYALNWGIGMYMKEKDHAEV